MSSPKLSILVYLRNQEEVVESVLSNIFAFSGLPLEIVIIDDASTDSTATLIDKLILEEDRSDVYFFANPVFKGRALCLNEALAQSEAPFVWAPTGLVQILPANLTKAVNELEQVGAHIAVQKPLNLPLSIPGWISLLHEGVSIPDDFFIFNRQALGQQTFCFNQFVEEACGFESCLRYSGKASIRQVPLFTNQHEPELQILNARDLKELTFAVIRHAKTTDPQRLDAFALISPDGVGSTAVDQNELDAMYEQANAHNQANDLPASITLCDKILRFNPYHENTLMLKISLLEKLKQFVEASELKHRLRRLRESENNVENSLKVDIPPKAVVEPTVSEDSAIEDDVVEETQESSYETDLSTNGEETQANTEDSVDEPIEEEQPVEEQHSEEVSQPEQNEVQVNAYVPFDQANIKTTIVIPTALHGKTALTHCLNHIHNYCDPMTAEIVIVDNASLDDSWEFLEQLSASGFFNTRVLTNRKNLGFAKSVNKALDMARGEYSLVLHNDAFLGDGALKAMEQLLEAYDELAVVGPILSSSENLMQVEAKLSEGDENFEMVPYVDSCCMLIRNSANLRFDTKFGLAFFEDIDLCMQAKQKGFKIAIAQHAFVEHVGKHTTSELGLNNDGEYYWKNAAQFSEKWELKEEFDAAAQPNNDILKLCHLAQLINFWKPDEDLVQAAKDILTIEIKTQIRESDFPDDKLRLMIELLMVVDERELLREMEQLLEPGKITESLLRKLAHFYFKKSIFSRARKYLELYPIDNIPFDIQLMYLDLLITDKELDVAVPLLERLFGEHPGNPTLNKLAGDVYRLGGNKEQSREYYSLAAQLDPTNYADLAM